MFSRGIYKVARSPPLKSILNSTPLQTPVQSKHYLFTRSFRTTAVAMGVERIVLVPGNGVDFPRERDDVEMHYIGSLVVRGEDGNIVRDNSGAPKKGEVFDSSRNRGAPFKTKIGIGKVIKGWDEGVPQMSLGEKATLEITPDFGYGPRGFPPLIPPNSTLLFEVELLAITSPGGSTKRAD